MGKAERDLMGVRGIKQIGVGVDSGDARAGHVYVYALADDGTLWRRCDSARDACWLQVEPLPNRKGP